MTETPTHTREAWQLVEGSSDDRVNIAVVVGPKSVAEQVAHEMNVERIQAATDSLGTSTILPVGVLAYPVRAVLPTEPKPGLDRDVPAQTDLDRALYRVVWEHRYGDGTDRQRRTLESSHPALYDALTTLARIYGETGHRTSAGAPNLSNLGDRLDDGGAEGQRYLDELSADVDRLLDNHDDAADEDARERYVGALYDRSGPTHEATARFAVSSHAWRRHHHGSFADDADGFATFVAVLVDDVLRGNESLRKIGVGATVKRLD